MSDTPAYAAGALLADKFRVVRVLGSGGMGSVYEITHELTRHRRALKLLHPRWLALDAVVERFLREASAAGRIGNPHIVETFDAGRLPSGEPYLVLEFLEGQTLADRLEGTRGLAVADAIDLVAQACDGAAAAHEAGIVHRDLKPENLFLTKGPDGRPFVKLLDFGVSKFDPKFTTDRATEGGGFVGTPFYMSPEQMRGEKDLDARSDVYALGVIAWECLTGEHPYPVAELPVLVAQVLSDKQPRLDETSASVPPELVEIVARAMAKDRSVRTASARAFGEELRAAASELDGLSRRPPPIDALGATEVADAITADPTVAADAPPALGAGAGAGARRERAAPAESAPPAPASVEPPRDPVLVGSVDASVIPSARAAVTSPQRSLAPPKPAGGRLAPIAAAVAATAVVAVYLASSGGPPAGSTLASPESPSARPSSAPLGPPPNVIPADPPSATTAAPTPSTPASASASAASASAPTGPAASTPTKPPVAQSAPPPPKTSAPAGPTAKPTGKPTGALGNKEEFPK